MNQTHALKKLSDAAELLIMLEQLTDGLSIEDRKSKRMVPLPWAGMRMTLSQVRQLVLQSYEELLDDEGIEFRDAMAEPREQPAATLASRIQQAPSTAGSSRVRELLGKVRTEDAIPPRVTVNE